MTLKTTFHIIALVGLLFFSTSCSNTSYEEGDSKLSYLRTDFADATTDSQGRLSAATTDDGVSLTFTRPMQTSWSNAADSLCRVLLNYNMYANGADSNVVEPLAAKIVYTLQPAKPSVQTQAATDPVSLVSAWKSKNGNYVNLRLGLKTGKASGDDKRQSIGLALDSTVTSDGSTTYCLRFLHSQGGVPEYYTTDAYVSIPIKQMTTGSKVRLSLNTYNGWVTREFTR
uniref:NigD1/NigD2 family lipoprotein n=1 Tax=Prevotella sp. TaxID=59823 RepID=UPI004027F5DE